MLQVVGPIRVAVPGTPVRVTDLIALTDPGGLVNTPSRFTCHAALFQAIDDNVGKVYVGLAGMVRATKVGVSAVLAIPTDNSIPSYSVALTMAAAGIDLSDLYLDADTAQDGVLLTVLVT